MKNTNKKDMINNILRKAIVGMILLSMVIGIMHVHSVEAKTSIKMNKKKITINPGDEYTLKVKGTKSTSTVEWSSSDSNIATVDSNGTVTANKAGECKIKAKVAGKKLKCKVTVTESKDKGKEETNPYKDNRRPGTNVIECESANDYFSKITKLIKDHDKEDKSGTKDVDQPTHRIVVGGIPDLSEVDPEAVIVSLFGEYIVQFSDSESAQKFLNAQQANRNVEYAEEDKYFSINDYVVNDNGQTTGSWGTDYIEARKLADYILKRNVQKKVVVAVVDTGVDYNHDFLAGRIIGKGLDFIDLDADALDVIHGHGTHVSGIIVDCTPDLLVMILPIRVLDYSGHGTSLTVANGIRAAIEENADVINLSLGGDKCNIVDSAIQDAVNAGVTVVCAAGNESSDTSYYSPAHNENCIVVSALDKNSERAYFSNYGRSVDVAAPGIAIRSCVPNNRYESWAGTSMAAPHVTAAAAMLKMIDPSYSPAEIEQILKKAAQDLGIPGRDDVYGDGALKLAGIVPAEISSISIASEPFKKDYFRNDLLITEGIKINVSYTNGTTETVDSGFSCYPMELTNIGTETIVVSYLGHTASFTVSVRNDDEVGISIIQLPTKLDYYAGEAIDITGIKVELTYASGKKVEISDGLEFSPKSFQTEGIQNVYVSRGQLTSTYTVNVHKAKITSLELVSGPDKKEYFDGEILDTTGIVVLVKYTNGESEKIVSGYTCYPTYLSISEVNTKDYSEKRKIVLQYEDMSVDFEVLVKAIVATGITAELRKTRYIVGEEIDPSDLNVIVNFSDGTSGSCEKYTVFPRVFTQKGEQHVSVSYENFRTELTVYVDEISISHIVIETLPEKRIYRVGETLDIEKLSVGVVNTDGTKEIITSGFTCTPMKLEKEGVQRITVLYGVYAAVFEVTVEDVEPEWIPASEAPAGAIILDRKWKYDLVENTKSKDSNLDGWTQVGSEWENVGTNTQKYAPDCPSTFDTNNEIYKLLSNGPVQGYVTDTMKREVENMFCEYCYYHFMYNVAYHATTERAISDRYGMYDVYGHEGKGFGYWYFSAFLSDVDAPYLDNYYCCSRNQSSYDCRNIMPDKSSLGSGTPRYFRFNVYKSVYTDYEKVFKYERTTHQESKTEVQPSESIRNVVEYVKCKL